MPPQAEEPAPPPPKAAPKVEPVPTGGPAKQEWKTKTDMFRDRMKEIRENEKGGDEPAAAEETPAEEPVASEPAPAKKKGCMGMLLIGIGLVSAGVAGSLQWLL